MQQMTRVAAQDVVWRVSVIRGGLAVVAVAIGCLLGAGPAAADGKVFTPLRAAPARMPDQQALLVWDGPTEGPGTQTLVIDSRFVADGEELAWVIPLPAVPEVSVLPRGLFTTLEVICAPAIVQGGGELATITLWLVFIPITLAGLMQVQRAGSLAGCCFVVGYVVFLCMLVTLSVNVGGGPGGARARVDVLQRERVGPYDIKTVGGREGAALSAWLRDEGFAVPARAEQVIARHAAAGGVFLTARLRPRREGASAWRIDPLCLRFEAPRPVYPMALTGADAVEPLALELYVFGPGRAAAPGLRVRRCSRPRAPEAGKVYRRPVSELIVAHPELRGLVREAAVMTHLGGTLSPQAMEQDLTIGWASFAATGEVAFSRSAALWFALDVAFPLCCLVYCARLASRPRGDDSAPGHRERRACEVGAGALAVLLVSALLALAAGLFAPTVATESAPGQSWYLDTLESLSRGAYNELYGAGVEDPEAWLRARLRDPEQYLPDINPYTGRPPTLEASPGNVTLGEEDGEPLVIWYDAVGQAHD